MSLSHVLLPSIAQVLTTDHVLIPRHPSVIKYGVDTSPVLLSPPPDYLMKTLDLRDEEPIEFKVSPYYTASDIGCHPSTDVNESENDGPRSADASSGASGEEALASAMKNKISRLFVTLRGVLPAKLAETCLRRGR